MKIYVMKYFRVMFIIQTNLFNIPLFWDRNLFQFFTVNTTVINMIVLKSVPCGYFPQDKVQKVESLNQNSA